MNLRILTAGHGVATILLTAGLSMQPAAAQEPRSSVLTRNQRSPDYSYQQGRTRIYVTKRSWLDMGNEVRPGDRKYTDYAIPPSYTQNTVDHLTGRPWTRSPL